MIAIGTRFYPAEADAERRQQRARQALLALDGVRRINLQFEDETYRPEGFRTLPVLRTDSLTVAGGPGRRKPIVSEMFDALARAASDEGCRYFVYLNADIEVTPAAIETIRSGGRDGYAFCRMDVDAATRAELGVEQFGLDMFAVGVDWWARERGRFRPYIAGEALWDNVYAAILCSHGRAAIVSERPGVLHESHSTLWGEGLFAAYNGYLAALDAPYFSRWAAYVARVRERRAAGLPVDADEIMTDVFGGRVLSLAGYARHAARRVRARMTFARTRARLAREASE